MRKRELIEDFLRAIERILGVYLSVRDLDESLAKLPPIAVAYDNVFYVFDITEPGGSYKFVIDCASSDTLPKRILAAFPLDFYGGKAAAVISQEELGDPAVGVSVFHEFVHCFQFNHGEKRLEKSWRLKDSKWTPEMRRGKSITLFPTKTAYLSAKW